MAGRGRDLRRGGIVGPGIVAVNGVQGERSRPPMR